MTESPKLVHVNIKDGNTRLIFVEPHSSEVEIGIINEENTSEDVYTLKTPAKNEINCPLCKKHYNDLISHLVHHGYTEEEAKRMIERVLEFGDY